MAMDSYTIFERKLYANIYNYTLFEGNGRINFKITKAGTLEIKNCSYPESKKDVGGKIELEIVENGYIIRKDKKTFVTTSEYEYKDLIDKAANIEIIKEINFNKEDWPELDTPQLIIEMNAKYKKLTGNN